MAQLGIFIVAAFCEIAGCFAFWAVLRQGAASAWLVVGTGCLLAFAYALTHIEVDFAGRAYAVYGGIYIVSSLVWLWAIEGKSPDRWDVAGAVVCLLGAAIILYAPRQV